MNRKLFPILIFFTIFNFCFRAYPLTCGEVFKYEGPRELNPDWLAIGGRMALTSAQARQMDAIYDWLSEIVSLGHKVEITNMRGPYLQTQFQALANLAARINSDVLEWQTRLKTESPSGGDVLIKMESDIERMDTLLKHNQSKLSREHQAEIDRLSERIGQSAKFLRDPRAAQIWITAKRQLLADYKKELESRGRAAQKYFLEMLPILQQVREAMDLIKNPSYMELNAFGLILAGIENYYSSLVRPGEVYNFLNGSTSALKDFDATTPRALLEEALDIAKAVKEGRPILPETFTGEFETLMADSQTALREGTIPIVSVETLSANVELIMGFLPIHFIRFPSEPAADRMYDSITSPGTVFIHDLMRVVDQPNLYNTYDIGIFGRGDLPRLADSYKIWHQLLNSATRSPHGPKTLALLHFLRFTEVSYDSGDIKVELDNPTSIVQFLIKGLLETANSGKIQFDSHIRGTIPQLEAIYQKEFGFSSRWTLNDMVQSIDILARPLIRNYDINTEAFEPALRDAIRENPDRAMTAYLANLQNEGRFEN